MRVTVRFPGPPGAKGDTGGGEGGGGAVDSVDARTGVVTLADRYAALVHAARHASNGADPITPVSIGAAATTDPRLSDERVPVNGSVTPAKLSFDAATQAELDAWTTRTDNPHSVTKAQVGLANVDNTADAAKPISTAAQTALDAKADLVGGKVPTAQLPAITMGESTAVNSQAAMLALTAQIGDVAVRTDLGNTKYLLLGADPTVLGNWSAMGSSGGAVDSVNGQDGVVVLGKADIGLGNVDNTADAAKPISTATQTALDAKQALDADLTAIAGLDSSTAGALTTDGSGWIRKTYAQLKTALALVKADVGLGNVDNTADTAKPVSTAQQAALDLKADAAATTTALAGKASTTSVTDEATARATADTAITTAQTTYGKGFIIHGATAGTARPTGYASIEWQGSVEPTNATNGDTWVVTS